LVKVKKRSGSMKDFDKAKLKTSLKSAREDRNFDLIVIGSQSLRGIKFFFGVF
jgi:transcriptional regulator NrdR family protein